MLGGILMFFGWWSILSFKSDVLNVQIMHLVLHVNMGEIHEEVC